MPQSPDPRPFDVRYIENPSQSRLRELALEHTPAILETRVGSLNKVSRNKARMAKYTYVIAEGKDVERWSVSCIAPDKARTLIDGQAAYIKEKGELIVSSSFV